eukprot:3227867-Rhodomonas_salina.2
MFCDKAHASSGVLISCMVWSILRMSVSSVVRILPMYLPACSAMDEGTTKKPAMQAHRAHGVSTNSRATANVKSMEPAFKSSEMSSS